MLASFSVWRKQQTWCGSCLYTDKHRNKHYKLVIFYVFNTCCSPLISNVHHVQITGSLFWIRLTSSFSLSPASLSNRPITFSTSSRTTDYRSVWKTNVSIGLHWIFTVVWFTDIEDFDFAMSTLETPSKRITVFHIWNITVAHVLDLSRLP